MIHHKLIQSLLNEIRSLREQMSYMEDAHCRHEERMEERNQRLRDENDRIERQRELDRQEQLSKQWQREDLMNKLERQERYGDDWGASRTRKELKNLY